MNSTKPLYGNSLEMVEAAGVGLRKTTSCQHLAQIRLAQARQNRSNRQVEVQIRYKQRGGIPMRWRADPNRSATDDQDSNARKLRVVDYRFNFANIEPLESLPATNSDTSKPSSSIATHISRMASELTLFANAGTSGSAETYPHRLPMVTDSENLDDARNAPHARPRPGRARETANSQGAPT